MQAYTAAVGAFCRAGDMRLAEQLLIDSARDGVSPGVRMYNQLIAAYGRRGDISGVQGKVREMREAGIPPNEATHGSLVAALVRCGELERAWFALKARKGSGGIREKRSIALSPDPRVFPSWSTRSRCAVVANTSDSFRPCVAVYRPITAQAGQKVNPPPGVRAYTALLQGLSAAGRFGDCLEVLDDMRQRGVHPNVVTFTTLANGMVSRGRLDEARGVLERMRAEGVQPNAVTYNTLLRGCAEKGELGECFRVVEEMAAAGLSPSLVSYNTLLNACVEGRETELATLAFKQLRAAGLRPDAVTYATLLKDCGLRGNVASARRTFNEMCSDPRVAVDTAAVNAMLAILVGAGECDEAEELLLSMQECGCAPDVISFGTLVGGFAMQDNLERAERVLERCRAALVAPDAQMFDDMIDLCCRMAAFDRARALISEMEQMGFKPDRMKYDRLLNTLYAKSRRGGTVVRRRNRGSAAAGGAGAGQKMSAPSMPSEIERFKVRRLGALRFDHVARRRGHLLLSSTVASAHADICIVPFHCCSSGWGFPTSTTATARTGATPRTERRQEGPAA